MKQSCRWLLRIKLWKKKLTIGHAVFDRIVNVNIFVVVPPFGHLLQGLIESYSMASLSYIPIFMSIGHSKWKLQADKVWLATGRHIKLKLYFEKSKMMSVWATVPNFKFFWQFVTEKWAIFSYIATDGLFVQNRMSYRLHMKFCVNQTMLWQT